jgi:hypothetical protein
MKKNINQQESRKNCSVSSHFYHILANFNRFLIKFRLFQPSGAPLMSTISLSVSISSSWTPPFTRFDPEIRDPISRISAFKGHSTPEIDTFAGPKRGKRPKFGVSTAESGKKWPFGGDWLEKLIGKWGGFVCKKKKMLGKMGIFDLERQCSKNLKKQLKSISRSHKNQSTIDQTHSK